MKQERKIKTVNTGNLITVRWNVRTLFDDLKCHETIKASLSWKVFPGKYSPRKTFTLYRFLMNTFFNMMMSDVIDNNVQINFTRKKKTFIGFLIADRDRNSYLYRYNIDTRGHDYIPYCITSPRIWSLVKRYYLIKMDPQWKKGFRSPL